METSYKETPLPNGFGKEFHKTKKYLAENGLAKIVRNQITIISKISEKEKLENAIRVFEEEYDTKGWLTRHFGLIYFNYYGALAGIATFVVRGKNSSYSNSHAQAEESQA